MSDLPLTEEEIFSSDIDPLEGLAQLRREEEQASSEESESQESEEPNEDETEIAEDTNEEDLSTDGGDEIENDPLEENNDPENVDEIEEDENNDTEDEISQESNEQENIVFAAADGQEYQFTQKEALDKFPEVFGKAMNFTQKTQKLSPYLKMVSALEEEGITADQLNVAIDALKGNKGAIKQIIDNHDIPSYDLSEDDSEGSPYAPTQYGKEPSEIELQEVVTSIAVDPEYSVTADVVQNKWDSSSQNQLASNPQLLRALHNDVKSGLYSKVAPEAMKLKVLDGNGKSDIEYYIIAGQNLSQSTTSAQTAQTKVDALNKQAQDTVQNADKASSEAKRKRSASSTRSRNNPTVVDYLSDNDEDFDAWHKKVMQSI